MTFDISYKTICIMILPVGEERQVGHRGELRPDGVHGQVRRAGVVGVAADVAHEGLGEIDPIKRIFH